MPGYIFYDAAIQEVSFLLVHGFNYSGFNIADLIGRWDIDMNSGSSVDNVIII